MFKNMIIQQNPIIYSENPKDEDYLSNLLDIISVHHVSYVHKIYQWLFKYCSCNEAKRISKEARQDSPFEGQSFVYGEITYPSFATILKHIKPYIKRDGVFYDLGSGTGRPVFAAALLSDFSRCRGIELVPELHQEADMHLERYEEKLLANYSLDDYYTNQRRRQTIEFIQGDILEVDWSDGDVVFANSTCFDRELMERLAIKVTTVALITLITLIALITVFCICV